MREAVAVASDVPGFSAAEVLAILATRPPTSTIVAEVLRRSSAGELQDLLAATLVRHLLERPLAASEPAASVTAVAERWVAPAAAILVPSIAEPFAEPVVTRRTAAPAPKLSVPTPRSRRKPATVKTSPRPKAKPSRARRAPPPPVGPDGDAEENSGPDSAAPSRSVPQGPFRVLDGDGEEIGKHPTRLEAMAALADDDADVVVDRAGKVIGRKGVDDEDGDEDAAE